MTDKPTVYLAGAINGKDDDEVFGWRREAASYLAGYFNVLDPTVRDYRGKEAENVNDIVFGDLQDIRRSQSVLVRAETPSWGTAMELVYAKEFGCIVVGFGAGLRPSPWLTFHCDTLCSTLRVALEHLVYTVRKDLLAT